MVSRVGLLLIILVAVAVSFGTDTQTALAFELPFGDGSGGAITFSSSAQFTPPVEAIVDSGASGGSLLVVSSPSATFMAGQKILIHQTQGAGAGAWEMNSVQSYALGNLTTNTPLSNAYASSGNDHAQVLVVPQYTNITINTGVELTARPWNGTVGGIFAFVATGTATISGTVNATGRGFRGGAPSSSPEQNTTESEERVQLGMTKRSPSRTRAMEVAQVQVMAMTAAVEAAAEMAQLVRRV